MSIHLSVGKQGEEIAVSHLVRNGYRILEQNYKNQFGEIDIVALDRDVVCFIEVKTRTTTAFGLPQEAVTRQKQKRIQRVACSYLQQSRQPGRAVRFDVVAVYAPRVGEEHIDIIKNAFMLS